MNKIFKFAALISVCLMAFAGCAPEEINTDQYSDDSVTFAGFAPNPVARGGALRISGSNLQKVSEVIIPGVEPITDIEVVNEGKYSEIRVIVPVDGPEIGKVSIVADGQTYVSLTDLTYSEPIIFTSFSTENTPAMPGDVITIKGDYMNNIRTIAFEGGTEVKEFVSQSRYEMEVAIPATAITGKIILGDVDPDNNPDNLIANLFYSEAELVIGDPTVKSADRGALKAGASITVAGDYLNMIKSASVGGVAVDFTLAEDNKSIVVALPATAGDGEVVLTSYAGKEFKAGAYTTIVPTELAIAAETRYKAGLKAVITGKDLDLVTGASLAGTALDMAYADGKISFAIPATAVDGTVVLSLANGKTVETEAIELVKPVVKGLSVTELVAGEKFAIEGTDLDLVTSVTLKGVKMEYEYDAESGKITVATVGTSATGSVELACENGVKVAAGELTVTYDSFVVVSSLPSEARIGDEITMTGANFNMIEAIYFGEVKVTGYSKRADDEMVFVIPAAVETGSYNMKFVLTTGEEETCASSIDVKGAMTTVVLFEGEHDLGSWSSNLTVSADKFAKIPYGAEMHLEFVINESTTEPWYQVKPMDMKNWAGVQSVIDTFGGDVMQFNPGTTHASLVLSDADLQLFAEAGVAFGGHFITITKVYFTYENGDSDPIFVSDVMINDFDQHGEHNAYWDNSWAGYATGKMDGDNGYIEITSEGSGWLINCNHQSAGQLAPVVDDTSLYNVKFDIWVPAGSVIAADSIVAQVVFCDAWYWIGNISNQEIVGKDKWATITIDYSSANVPATLDMSSGSQGLAIEGSGALLPVGAKIDNFRLSLK